MLVSYHTCPHRTAHRTAGFVGEPHPYSIQVSPPTNLLKHGSHAGGGGGGDDESDSGIGGVGKDSGDGGALDVFTLSGGLSRDWRLPGVLRRLGSWGAGNRQAPAGGAGGAGQGGGGGGRGSGGSVSSFLDVKTGCLLEEGVAPRPFTQEVSVKIAV